MNVYAVVSSNPRHLGRLAAPEVGAQLAKSSVLRLSIGAFKQHGCLELATAFPPCTLLIINGNGENRGVLEALLYEIKRDHGFNACVTHPTALLTVKSGSPLPEVHGGMSEPSVMMALAPSVVHMELIPDSYAPEFMSSDTVRQLVLVRGMMWPWSSDDAAITSHGIIGHARRADVETGRWLIESAVQGHDRMLAALRERSHAGE